MGLSKAISGVSNVISFAKEYHTTRTLTSCPTAIKETTLLSVIVKVWYYHETFVGMVVAIAAEERKTFGVAVLI